MSFVREEASTTELFDVLIQTALSTVPGDSSPIPRISAGVSGLSVELCFSLGRVGSRGDPREIQRGGGILVVKVTDSRLACQEFKPSTDEDPLCNGVRCTLNMSRLKLPACLILKGEEVGASSAIVLVT
ncbi:hypothetical protein TNCV_2949691 [Trichonephila clavipes]|nr:hypothetical protein TNCV_2949691 [Trichonephila clavipes]